MNRARWCSWGGVALLGVFGVLALLIEIRPHWQGYLDSSVLTGLNRIAVDHPSLTSWWSGVSTVGQPLVFRVVAVVVGAWLVLRGQIRAVVFLLLAVGVPTVLSTALKVAFDRPRPVPPHAVAHAAGASFPSGHSLAAASVAAALCLLPIPGPPAVSRTVRILLACAAVAVAFSRLALGVHYLTDVLAGVSLGVACACLGWWVVFRTSPVVGPVSAPGA